ncbi:rhizoxin biosynthesis acyltransferase [Pseudoalteromonas citrea]|uniref:[acyl-carrier-protein] S-malonyltransferase n=2 Tax=Pseudoalteromonas citrea TaxID=43655 RepID=A0AAD4AJ18_9GAMM|nr:ACP S-malonyltransferase [Pseudoalteromonas citrea]KAF7771536.1 rhizoxin biosynthesis acyltransferase [Pseudoalteromonas citrea]
MNTYLFPGQGSQYKGMGKALFAQFPEQVDCANNLLGYSISELCTQDPHNQLNNTQYTQPALFVVSVLAYLHHIKTAHCAPNFFAGHSLGEFAALYASGAITFEDALKLVIKRGELMSAAPRGAMAAIIGTNSQALLACLHNEQLSTIDIANFNSHDQLVISGLVDDITRAQTFIEKLGARFIQLNTSGAFHSRYMMPAKTEFASYLNSVSFSALNQPVIANVTAQPYQFADIKHTLIEQITSPVKWTQSIEYLLAQGDMQFTELGPKKVLTKLVHSIEQNSCAKQSLHTANPAEKQPMSPQHTIDNWNRHYPIGTRVKLNTPSSPYHSQQLTTRSQAQLLFGHRPVVYITGYSGYFALTQLQPM